VSLRLGALHDALLHPGDADLATRAAEEVASDENRLASIDTRLTLLTWMVTTNLLLTVAVLGRLLFIR
jgi:hypothetical protein